MGNIGPVQRRYEVLPDDRSSEQELPQPVTRERRDVPDHRASAPRRQS